MVLPGLTGRKPEFLGVKGMDIPTTFKNSALFPLAGNIQLGSFGKKRQLAGIEYTSQLSYLHQ